MLFSSLIFLFCFLPITLFVYYLFVGTRFRNAILLLASLIFFAWGGVSNSFILIGSIIINFFFGKSIQKHRNTAKGRKILWWGVGINILILFFFKYAGFMLENINSIKNLFDSPPYPALKILLPVGISFYTFHAISYLVDIFRNKCDAQKNILDLSLYITMFSQLIAGPIIRYSDVWIQLKNRVHNTLKFQEGIERFVIGLGKKVLIANCFAKVADEIFAFDFTSLSWYNAWLGIISYSLQIYFDFAGYSDMAIGLGKMFGFDFMENFNFPYKAKSVRDFWHRWHISLSTFFRDYVYIPLGGNQVSNKRVYINLLIVFFLTGFWHGASWSFVIWGLFHGFFIVLERLFLKNVLNKIGPLSNIYLILVVIFSWVLFRIENIDEALLYWSAMFNFTSNPLQLDLFCSFVTTEYIIVFVVAIVGSAGIFSFLNNFNEKIVLRGGILTNIYALSFHTISAMFYIALMILCTLYLNNANYNPFIYYRF